MLVAFSARVVPDRERLQLTSEECEIGLGIHNEPGVRKISPIPTPAVLVGQMLDLLLKSVDAERAFVPFKSGDEVRPLICEPP